MREWILAVAVIAGEIASWVVGAMNRGIEGFKIKGNAAFITVLKYQGGLAALMAAQAALIECVLALAPVITPIILCVDGLDTKQDNGSHNEANKPPPS
jgi:hypothetical protein